MRKLSIPHPIRDIATLAALACLTLCACSRGGGDTRADYTLTAYAPRHAAFTIDSAAGRASTVITVRNPWQSADSAVYHLFVSRNGEEPPAGFDGAVVRAPARRIVAMSSTFIAMLDAIGAADRVTGVSGIDYITNRHIQEGRDTIADVGYEGAMNYEALIASRPDLVLLYGVNGPSAMEGKLRELGVPFMYVGDYVEPSPLGKAEWMVALGEIAGLRGEAERTFAAIEARYDSLACKAAEAAHRPVVMLNTPYNDSWFLPPMNSYMVRLISDAGGHYAYDGNNSRSTTAVDTESAYVLTDNADLWINADAASMAALKRALPKFANTRPVKTGQVYSNRGITTPSGGNDFFESGVVHPDIVLGDLMAILHPELAGDTALVYYKKLQ